MTLEEKRNKMRLLENRYKRITAFKDYFFEKGDVKWGCTLGISLGIIRSHVFTLQSQTTK